MNRKFSVKLLSVVLSVLMILGCIPFAVAAEESKTVSIATINDIHYYTKSLAGNMKDPFYTYLEGHNCVYEDLDAILDAALLSLEYEAENNGLKYVVITGDLTTNGEYEGHKALSEKLLAFKERTGINVYVTPGNHDINNPRASSFVNDIKEEAKMTSPVEFYELYKELGFSDAYHQFSEFTANKGGSLSYSVKTEDGYRLILADAGKFTPDVTESGEAKQETAGAFTQELLQWVLSEAEDAKKDGEIPLLFTHWNMSGMNYFHEYLMQGFVIDDGYMLQEILADAGINYSFGGHQHVSDVAITYSDSGNPMYSVITPTVTQFPFAYRVTDFTKNNEGGLDVTFHQRSCDEYSGVNNIAGTGTYPAPYRETGFYKQFGYGADAADYIFSILKSTLDKYIGGIRAEGSIVGYIEKELEIDIEETVNNYLFGGITCNGNSILSGKNVMSFLNDLDGQLMGKYIYNKNATYALIRETLHNICDTQVSEVPCTKFIEEYGFGDTEKGGTLGDAVLSVIATMYYGNEDISDDLFLQDIVRFSGEPEFLDLLLDIVRENIVESILIDNILANIDFNISSLFVDNTVAIGEYVQLVYSLLLSTLDSGILNTDNFSDFMYALKRLLGNTKDVSLKRLAETVLGTGLISYGSTIDELIDNLIEMFLPQDVKETAVYQAQIVIGGMVTDDTKDHGVTYTNNGAIEVIPTEEDMQLPVNVTMTPGEDGTSFTVNWFTKYSVTGTDIEIVKADESFKGVASTENIKAVTEETTYTAPGFDLGEYAILPWTHKIIKHTVTVTGLDTDTEYKFTIGDFTKGFTAECGITTAPEKGDAFTFIHISDSAGYIPSDYENLTAVLNKADELYPDSRFIVHTSSLTEVATNDDQWSFATDAAKSQLRNKPLVYAPGESDLDGDYSVSKYLPVPYADGQASETGLYYSYDYADAHFIVLNTNNMTSGGTLSGEQTLWLKNDLESSTAHWNILIMSQSIYSDSEASTLRTQIATLMEDYDIDLILQGSESIYVRTDYFSGNTPVLYNQKTVTVQGESYTAYTDAKGTVAVISSSAGRSFGGEAPSGVLYDTVLDYSLPMFSAITIEGDVLAVSAYTVDGDDARKVDSFAIEKSLVSIKLGDIDKDGKITATDARATLRCSVALDKLSAEQKAAADVNLDGTVTAADARIILRASVSLEEITPEYITKRQSELDNM